MNRLTWVAWQWTGVGTGQSTGKEMLPPTPGRLHTPRSRPCTPRSSDVGGALEPSAPQRPHSSCRSSTLPLHVSHVPWSSYSWDSVWGKKYLPTGPSRPWSRASPALPPLHLPRPVRTASHHFPTSADRGGPQQLRRITVLAGGDFATVAIVYLAGDVGDN